MIALSPTPESHDHMWTCDPGVIKFGGYYYIGYTTTADERGVDNDVCIARSKTPDGGIHGAFGCRVNRTTLLSAK